MLAVTEEALEDVASRGEHELLVECDGCSERMRVLFALDDSLNSTDPTISNGTAVA